MKKVLLVDDDPVIRQAYQGKLLAAGFQVELAADGLSGMILLNSARPDVVVLDMMMPQFSGLEVLKYIRSEPALKNVRVIILSNMFFGGEQREAATVEADKALLKSDCTPALLIEAINEVLQTNADSKSPAPPDADVERRLPE